MKPSAFLCNEDIIYADIDDCTPDPCQNGAMCVDRINDYVCVCPAGYTDKQCQTGNDFHCILLFSTGKFFLHFPLISSKPMIDINNLSSFSDFHYLLFFVYQSTDFPWSCLNLYSSSSSLRFSSVHLSECVWFLSHLLTFVLLIF